DTLLVTFDTIKPIITCPISYSITTCNPNYISVNATSNNTLDSVKWSGQGIPVNNPALIYNANNYIIEAKRNSNGCKATVIVTVKSTIIPPKINISSIMDTISQNIPILDTLTCAKDSIALNFSSNSVNSVILIKRPLPFNDTIANKTYSAIAGIYTAYIKDTITHCFGNPLLFEVKINRTLPQVSILTTAPSLNCSVSNSVLDGMSGTPNAQLTWTGPNNFISADPATVTKIGSYILFAVDPGNGCIKSDTVIVVKQNKLIIIGNADTIICNGTQLKLNAIPVGGTPNFIYNWSNGGNNFVTNVNPADTAQYFVTITDGAGCVGKDTIVVNVPESIKDSIITFQSCDPVNPKGQIQILANGGIPPYRYSIDNGLNYLASSIFNKLSFATYPIIITDSLNCYHISSATINKLSQQPKPDFIVNTNMMQADTFVVVDISNPRPDTVIWTFPSSVTLVNTNPFAPVIISVDTGIVIIDMEAHFGNCVANLTKAVRFIKADTIPDSPKGNGIESITLFPNPNSGQFSVEVKLFKKQTFAIYVYNAKGIEQARMAVLESNYSLNTINLPAPTPGTYLLKVIAEYDSKSQTIVITD
nr:T9SS type A sorting domain-containing protein [Bacteroidota bacterium]